MHTCVLLIYILKLLFFYHSLTTVDYHISYVGDCHINQSGYRGTINSFDEASQNRKISWVRSLPRQNTRTAPKQTLIGSRLYRAASVQVCMVGCIIAPFRSFQTICTVSTYSLDPALRACELPTNNLAPNPPRLREWQRCWVAEGFGSKCSFWTCVVLPGPVFCGSTYDQCISVRYTY